MKTAKAHNAPLTGEIETYVVGGTKKTRREIKKAIRPVIDALSSSVVEPPFTKQEIHWAKRCAEYASKLGQAIGTIEGVLLWDIPPKLKKILRKTLKELDGQPKE